MPVSERRERWSKSLRGEAAAKKASGEKTTSAKGAPKKKSSPKVKSVADLRARYKSRMGRD